MAGAGKDLMAAYVRQLLELDESRRRATLDNLSKYELTEVEGQAAPGAYAAVKQPDAPFVPQEAATMPLKVNLSSRVGGQAADPKYEPATVQLPPGLGAPQQPGLDARQAMARAQVMNAQNAQKDISLSRVTTPPVAKSLMEQQPYFDGSTGMASQFSRPEQQGAPQTQQLTKILEKALFDLNSTLWPQDSAEVQRLLATFADQQAAPNLPPNGQMAANAEVLKWLPKLLAKQQEASIQKLAKLMGATMAANTQGMNANMGQLPPGIAPGLPLPTPGMGASSAAAMTRPPAWGRVDAQPGMAQPGMHQGMPDASFMSQMHRQTPAGLNQGLHQWWGAAASMKGQGQGQMQMQAPTSPNSPGAHSAKMAMKRQPISRDQKHELLRGAARRNGIDTGDAMYHAGAAVGSIPDGVSNGETLRMHLRSLIKIESARILIVRKINRLGFASPELLKNHYSWFGTVENVLVAHSRVKSSAVVPVRCMEGMPSRTTNSRLRPSGLGFLIMSKVEEAEAILAAGPEQIVYGAVIRVQHFERRTTEDDGLNLEDDNDNGADIDQEDMSPDGSFPEADESV